MDYSTLRKIASSLTTSISEEVSTRIEREISALRYVGASLEGLAIFLILKNSGGYVLFKTIKGYIIEDMGDESYISSRELLGLNNWNYEKGFRLEFGTDDVYVKPLSFKELNRVLVKVLTPPRVTYLAHTIDNNAPVALTFDRDVISGLTYKEYLSCLKETFYRKMGERIPSDAEVVFTLVGYEDRESLVDDQSNEVG